MPIRSKEQLKWLQANKPEVAKQLLQETPKTLTLPTRLGLKSLSEKRRKERKNYKLRKKKTPLGKLTKNLLRNQAIARGKIK